MVSKSLWIVMTRSVSFVAALAVSELTSAQPRSICPAPSARANGSVFSEFDDSRKISESDIFGAPVSPATMPLESRTIPAGTELNAVYDLDCMARRHDSFAGKGLRSFTWKLDRDRTFSELRASVESDPCLRRVSRNVIYELAAFPNDPLFSRQTHYGVLRFVQAIVDFMPTMMAVRRPVIAIIDSGVDFDHEDLNANRWVNPREVAANGIDDDGDGYVDDVNGYGFASGTNVAGPEGDRPESNHGTHVAGLAAARMDNAVGGTGVAGVARVMSLNVFGKSNSTNSAIVENAVRYAADHGADVINMSLGGREFSRTMRDALAYAVSKGSFVVTAAGNFGFEICEDPSSMNFVSPAAYARQSDGMVAVASIDVQTGKMSAFSNFSTRLVEISAPGAYSSDVRVGLVSTFPRGAYAELAGTSMSAPVVAGAAALVVSWLRAHGYPVTPSSVKTILLASTRREPRLKGLVSGSRTLDLKALVEYLKRNFRESSPVLR